MALIIFFIILFLVVKLLTAKIYIVGSLGQYILIFIIVCVLLVCCSGGL